MENLAVKLGNQPFDRSSGSRLFQPRDFQSTHAGLPTLQLDQANIQEGGILSAQTEGDGVDNAGSRSAGCTLEKGHTPTMLRTVRLQRFLARGFGCARLYEGVHALARVYCFCRRRAAFSGARCFLYCGKFIRLTVFKKL